MIILVTGAVPGFATLAQRFDGEGLDVNGMGSMPSCYGCSAFASQCAQR